MELSILLQFFIYMTGINLIIYLISLFSFIHFRKGILKFYLSIMNKTMKEVGDFEMIVLGRLGQYELLILVFNIMPLIALKCLIG